MRQRANIIRTLIYEPSVILMDEPFGPLDAQTRLSLQALLLSIWENQRSTVLFVTHDLTEAIALADRVVLMSARPGRIVRVDPVEIRGLATSSTFTICRSSASCTMRSGASWRPNSMTSVDTPSEPTRDRRRNRARSSPASGRALVLVREHRIGADEPPAVRDTVPGRMGVWGRPALRSFFFSTPMRILAQVARELVDPGFYRDLGVTSLEMAVGFTDWRGSGIGLGVLLARWEYVAKVLDPFPPRALQHSPHCAGADAHRLVRHRLFVEDIPRSHAGVLHHLLQHALRHPRRRQGAVRHRAGDEGDRVAGLPQGDAAERIQLDSDERQDQPAVRAGRRHPRRVFGILAGARLSAQPLFDELQYCWCRLDDHHHDDPDDAANSVH